MEIESGEWKAFDATARWEYVMKSIDLRAGNNAQFIIKGHAPSSDMTLQQIYVHREAYSNVLSLANLQFDIVSSGYWSPAPLAVVVRGELTGEGATEWVGKQDRPGGARIATLEAIQRGIDERKIPHTLFIAPAEVAP